MYILPFRPLDNILKYTYQYITFGHGLFNNIPILFFLKIVNVNFISIYFSNTIVVWESSWYIVIQILPRSQHISCWLVLFDAWMKVLATPSSLILIFKKGYYILAEAITLLSICIRIAHKSFETLGRAVVVLMLWLLPTGKQICRSFCHFWKNVGSNYLTRRTDIWIYVHMYLFLKWYTNWRTLWIVS